MRKHALLGFLVGAVCLYFAFRGISFRQLAHTLSQAQPHWILLGLGIYLLAYLMRAKRWAVLIRTIRPISTRQLFWPLIIGFFANSILPLRMGEFVRAHVCGTKFKISRSASLGSIVLERLCDTLSFLATFVLASFFNPFPPFVEKGAYLLGAACALCIILLIWVQKNESIFQRLLDRRWIPARWKSRIQPIVTHFLRSTSDITKPIYVAEAMGFSLFVWIAEGTFLWIMAHAFNVPLNYPQAFFLLFVIGLSVTLPQAPGYVGTVELFGVTALTLLGIPKDQGLSLILAIHGTQFLFISALGVCALWAEGLSFSALTTTKSDTISPQIQ